MNTMKARKDLIVLHGVLGSQNQLKPIIDSLTEFFTVYSFDFKGHGGESINEAYSIPLFAKQLDDFIEENKLSNPNVFGYSMGGYVALFHARQYPSKLGDIITLGSKFYWDKEGAKKEVKMLNPQVIEEKVPAFASNLKERHAPEDWKKVMEYTANMMLGLGEKNALNQEDYKCISNQVHVCIGDEDKMVTLEETGDVASWLKNGTVVAIEGVKHPIEQVDIEQLVNCIHTFIEVNDE